MAKKTPSQRKGWTQLSPTYRNRLKRNGITADSYRAGASLHKARGKQSAKHENDTRRFWRMVDRAEFDKDEVAEVVAVIGMDEAVEIMSYRQMALEGGNPFAAGAMRVLYGQYAELVPKEWLYYHGGAK